MEDVVRIGGLRGSSISYSVLNADSFEIDGRILFSGLTLTRFFLCQSDLQWRSR